MKKIKEIDSVIVKAEYKPVKRGFGVQTGS